MRRMTRREREAFLAEPRIAVLSVAGEEGRPPLAAPCFYAYEPGGQITFFTNTERRRARKVGRIEATGRVSLTVQDTAPPYRYVTAEAAVVGAERRPAAERIVAIAGRYMPREYAEGLAAAELGDDESTFVLYAARPERWLTADFGDGA
jgi:uncharacterized protein